MAPKKSKAGVPSSKLDPEADDQNPHVKKEPSKKTLKKKESSKSSKHTI